VLDRNTARNSDLAAIATDKRRPVTTAGRCGGPAPPISAHPARQLDSEIMEHEVSALQTGPAYRFSTYANHGEIIPRTGAGVYTIFDDAGEFIYVGIAGRNPAGSGLASRLRSHASGRRSGDQFCVYVADHYVMPILSSDQIEAIRDGQLQMDALVRDHIHQHFVFRFTTTETYRDAMAIENLIKAGALGPHPRLNPISTR
jgi:hypothetical protein